MPIIIPLLHFVVGAFAVCSHNGYTIMSSTNVDLGKFTSTGGSQSDSDAEEVKLLSPCAFSSPENALSARVLTDEQKLKRFHEIIANAPGAKPLSAGVPGGVANYPLADISASSFIKRVKRVEPEKESAFASAFASVPRSFGIPSPAGDDGLIVAKAALSPPGVNDGIHLDDDVDYFNCPVSDVPASPVTPKGLTKKQREKTNELNALVMDWRACEGALPSVRSFEPFTCNCEDTTTKKKAKMAVKPTMRGDLIIRPSKKEGEPSKFWFADVPSELGGKLRSFVCTSWGMRLNSHNKPFYYVKPGRKTGVQRCHPVPIDVGEFDANGKLLSFRLNTPVRHFWMTPEGKKVGKSKEGEGKEGAEKEEGKVPVA